jgi:hypothetical protein
MVRVAKITCHPLALLPLRLYLHVPLTSPVLSLLTGTWKRTFFSNENVDELDLKQRRYADADRPRELLSSRKESYSGSLRLVVAA